MMTLLTRPWLALGLLGGFTLACAALDVWLRERCETCGERVRVPLEAHWLADHAGETL